MNNEDTKIVRKILIRYSELTLKGKNRGYFSNKLFKNINKKFNDKNLKYKSKKHFDRVDVFPEEKNIDIYFSILNKISGISWFSEVITSKYENDSIKQHINYFLTDKNKKFKFRISSKDRTKKFFNSSDDLTRTVAKYILTNYKNSVVSLENYDYEIKIYINNKNEIETYILKHKGIIGLPSGVNGNGITLLSGGIDSPVAAIKSITRGIRTSFITFFSSATYEENLVKKINLIANKINEYNDVDTKLFLVNFSKIQKIVSNIKEQEYKLIILRRYFLKFTNYISSKYDFNVLITGDSLGQVSSQTLESIEVIDNASERFILRPLVTYSKEEIIFNAKKMNTYELSNMPGDDMCILFTPKNPKTKPKLSKVQEIEERIDKDIQFLFEIILEKDTKIVKLGSEKNE